jgi:hypothetical protein
LPTGPVIGEFVWLPRGQKLGIGLTAPVVASRDFPGSKMSRFVLCIASHLLHWITDRRCPACGRAEVRRSTRKNFFEAALLPFLLTRPFRCDRFYCLALRRRVSSPFPRNQRRTDLLQNLRSRSTKTGRTKSEVCHKAKARLHEDVRFESFN